MRKVNMLLLKHITSWTDQQYYSTDTRRGNFHDQWTLADRLSGKQHKKDILQSGCTCLNGPCVHVSLSWFNLDRPVAHLCVCVHLIQLHPNCQKVGESWSSSAAWTTAKCLFSIFPLCFPLRFITSGETNSGILCLSLLFFHHFSHCFFPHLSPNNIYSWVSPLEKLFF